MWKKRNQDVHPSELQELYDTTEETAKSLAEFPAPRKSHRIEIDILDAHCSEERTFHRSGASCDLTYCSNDMDVVSKYSSCLSHLDITPFANTVASITKQF